MPDDGREGETFWCFGPGPHPRMGRELSADAPFEDRLRSIWAWLVEQIRLRHDRLAQTGCRWIDPDDLIQQVALELRKRDKYFDPSRGKYTTFAKFVIRNVMSGVVEQAGACRVDSDGRKRRLELDAEAESGRLGSPQLAEHARLGAALAAAVPINGFDFPDNHQPDRGLIEIESRREARARTVTLIRRLEPGQAWLLGRSRGLWGREVLTPARLAGPLGLKAEDVPEALEDLIDRCRQLAGEEDL